MRPGGLSCLRITSYNVCYTKLLRLSCTESLVNTHTGEQLSRPLQQVIQDPCTARDDRDHLMQAMVRCVPTSAPWLSPNTQKRPRPVTSKPATPGVSVVIMPTAEPLRKRCFSTG